MLIQPLSAVLIPTTRSRRARRRDLLRLGVLIGGIYLAAGGLALVLAVIAGG